MRAELVAELYSQIELISNSSIRSFVQDMVSLGRASFFTQPASRDHHLPDERGESGNLLHTIRVVKIVLVLVDACSMTKDSKDVLVASAILHDLCRYDLEGEYSGTDHPMLVRKMAEEYGLTCSFYELIMDMVEKHMGKWGDPPFTPKVGMDAILHLADCVEAHLPEVIQC
ncbi:hypothetical protein ES703_113755 [subsurface metagenome]